MNYDKSQLIRGVASSTAIETGQPVEEVEEQLKKFNAHQDIEMQLGRLTKILDDLYNCANNNLGVNHLVTTRALKASLYFEGLKCDLRVKITKP